MFQYRAVILGRIAVLESSIDISLGIGIALFLEQDPCIGIQISAVVRFRLIVL